MVILVDQRDHGKSEHTDAFNYQLLADDLASFMEENWIHEAIVVGHSMGGKTAMQFAASYPDMVEKLVVVDIGPKAYKPGHEVIFKALNAVPIDMLESRKEAEEILSEYISDKGVRLFLMKNLQRKKEGGFRWKMNLPLIESSYDNILSSIIPSETVDVETLFLYGTKSKYIVEEDIEGIKDSFINAEFTAIEAGHWIHAERPGELLNAVKEFLG